jgi:hypothetical protein
VIRINVGDVLRRSANLPYGNLVTRSTGAAVRRGIEAELDALGDDDVATLDFSQIGMMDYSCADEVVAKLLLEVAVRRTRSAFLVLHGITDEHLEAIEDVLLHHGLALVVRFADGASRLVGAVTAEERAIWELVHERGAGEAGDLARAVDRGPDETATILQTLHARRLLRLDGATYVPLSRAS